MTLFQQEKSPIRIALACVGFVFVSILVPKDKVGTSFVPS